MHAINIEFAATPSVHRPHAFEVHVAELRRVGPAKFPTWAGLPPLWTLVVAASFFGYFALIVYCDVVRPINPGFTAETRDGAVIVDMVKPGTPAAEAGLTVGDRLIGINGLFIVDSDSWGAVGANYEIDVPMPVIVERQGLRLSLTLRLPHQPVDFWLTRAGATLVFIRLAATRDAAGGHHRRAAPAARSGGAGRFLVSDDVRGLSHRASVSLRDCLAGAANPS